MTGCVEVLKVSRIKVEENKRRVLIKNDSKEKYIKYKVDGCLISGQIACDYVIAKPKVGDVIIELKGTDVDHAVLQILNTANYWKKNKLNSGSLAALVVCTRYPRIDTKIQRAKSKFARDFKGPLHVVTKNEEFEFVRLLSFKGPL